MMVFKVSIVKFLNNCSKMKKSSPSFDFLNNSFKEIKEICNGNASEIK